MMSLTGRLLLEWAFGQAPRYAWVTLFRATRLVARPSPAWPEAGGSRPFGLRSFPPEIAAPNACHPWCSPREGWVVQAAWHVSDPSTARLRSQRTDHLVGALFGTPKGPVQAGARSEHVRSTGPSQTGQSISVASTPGPVLRFAVDLEGCAMMGVRKARQSNLSALCHHSMQGRRGLNGPRVRPRLSRRTALRGAVVPCRIRSLSHPSTCGA
jgi:hypothetical protein